jgi:hypothetical protein
MKNNMRTIVLVSILSAFICLANAQTQPYTFKVLVSNGKTEIKSANAWQSIKVGSSLKSSDEVKIAEKAYLGLIHVSGKQLELREAGSFKVSDLVSRLGAGSSVLNKYTDFILSSKQEKNNRLSATGAVHRGFKDVIIVYLPSAEKAELFGDKIGLQWSSDEVKGPYEVVFTNLLEDELARFTTNENQILVAMNEGGLKDEYEIIVKVISKENRGKGSKDYVIKKLRPADREKYVQALNEIKGSVAEENALTKYILAGFYEENFLLSDAVTAYQEAIKLAPDVALYRDSYNDFLGRLGFEIE